MPVAGAERACAVERETRGHVVTIDDLRNPARGVAKAVRRGAHALGRDGQGAEAIRAWPGAQRTRRGVQAVEGAYGL